MSAGDRRRRVERLFQELLDQPGGARDDRLRRACGDDTALRDEVLELLRLHDQPGHDQLDEPLLWRVHEAGGLTGTCVGHYEVGERLGAGGCGVVYRARQTAPVQRTVAVKVIRMGMNTRQVVSRFETERQVLAAMDHPGIATVFDAGVTDGGQPYFVMEWVDGAPLIQFCTTHGLDLRARLALFVKICSAVDHAHCRGIIHRDLKPGNILVRELDGRPCPKIIDFGIAKAMEGSATTHTLVTETGQLVGTPQYMSPEQCAADPDRVDTRSDVYALGVVLYELLTGRLPYDLDTAHYYEIPRIVREEPVRRPSTTHRALRGDLETVLLRALEKDPARRYGSVAHLGAELQRVLDHQPIEARRDSTWYVMRKAYARHRLPATLALTLVGSVCVGAVVLGILFTKAEGRRQLLEIQGYHDSIRLAGAARDEGNGAAMRSSLERAPPSRRRWEWNHLARQCDSSTWRLPGRFGAAAVSADGNRGAAMTTRAVQVVDLHTGEVVRTLPADDTPCPALAFAGEDRWLIVGGVDYLARVWDLTTGLVVWEIPSPCPSVHRESKVWSVPGTSLMVTWGRGSPLTVWDLATRAAVVELAPAVERDAASLGVSRDGRRMAFAEGGVLRLWDTHERCIGASFGAVGPFASIVFHPSEPLVFVADRTGRVTCWDLVTGDERSRWTLDGEINGLGFSPQHGVVVAGCTIGLELLAADSGQVVRRLIGENGCVAGALLTSDGNGLLSFGSEGLHFRDLDQRDARVIARPNAAAEGLAWSPCGRWLVSSGLDRTIEVFDARTLALVRTLTAPTQRLKEVAFSPDGRQLAWHDASREAVVFTDLVSGETADRTLPSRAPVWSIAWSPNGEQVVVGQPGAGADLCALCPNVLEVWSVATGEIVQTIDGYARSRFSPDGRAVVAYETAPWGGGGDDATPGCARIDVDDPRGPAWTWAAPTVIKAAAWAPDGNRLVIGDYDGVIWVLDAATGGVLEQVQDHRAPVLALAMWPDGHRLVSAAKDRSNAVRDTLGLQALLSLDPAPHGYSSVTISPDGQRVAAADYGHAVYVWIGDPVSAIPGGP